MNIILKLQERSPVKSVVVRKASCLSPVNMARQSEISVAKFESLVNKLFQGKHLTAKEADGAKGQSEFNFSDDRRCKYQDLWKVCIFVFTMSHGQGAVERGFNINKQLLVENILKTSTRGQRLVYDYFQSLNVKLHEYVIPKELLLSCKQAHSRYEEARRKTNESETNNENQRKRKMKEDEMADIKRQKLSLERSIKSMQVDVDNYLTQAEEKNISCLVKANALRKIVREKENSVKDLEKAIEKLECELKNLK